MLERLQSVLPMTDAPRQESSGEPFLSSPDLPDALLSHLGGAVFGEGLYRLFTPAAVAGWIDLARAAFPDVAVSFPFGRDWLGRQFAVGPQREVLVLEIFSGQVLRTGVGLGRFHDEMLPAEASSVLELPLFEEWRASGGAAPSSSECIELVVPAFLGGEIGVSNLGITDVRVYWDLTAQLLEQVRGLDPGTRVSDVRHRWKGEDG